MIELLLEPLDASWDDPLDALAVGDRVTIVTVTDSADDEVPVGSRAIVQDESVSSVPDREPIPEPVVESISDTIDARHQDGKTTRVQTETDRGEFSVVIDGLEPVNTLLLFGSQPNLGPLSKLASDVGFDVTIYSPRGTVEKSTFPYADRVSTGHPSEIADVVTEPDSTYVVVMSHNLIDDRLAVEHLLKETDVPYVGLMGPRERFTEICEESESIAEDDGERIATPVGLDLGGGAPVEIALSVVSEVLAVSNDRGGGRLIEKTGPIHTRITESK